MTILLYRVWLAWNHTTLRSSHDLHVTIDFYGTFYDFNVFIDHHIWLSMGSMFFVCWQTRVYNKFISQNQWNIKSNQCISLLRRNLINSKLLLKLSLTLSREVLTSHCFQFPWAESKSGQIVRTSLIHNFLFRITVSRTAHSIFWGVEYLEHSTDKKGIHCIQIETMKCQLYKFRLI